MILRSCTVMEGGSTRIRQCLWSGIASEGVTRSLGAVLDLNETVFEIK